MQADPDDMASDGLVNENGELTVEALELLPPGRYALIMFTRWTSELYPDPNATPMYGDEDTFELEWREAVADGSALILPNLEPKQLPAAYEMAANCVEFGAAIVGQVFQTDEEFEAFCGVYGRHVVTMDDLLQAQQSETAYVLH